MNKNSKTADIKLKILFWNTRSFRQRSKEIPRILKDLDILVCVESWLQPEHSIHYPGFLSFRKDRTHARGGGILILIRKSLAYLEITDLTSPEQNIEMCGININNLNPSLNLIIIYRAPDSTLSLETWENLFLNFKKPNCIVMGDFNSNNIIGIVVKRIKTAKGSKAVLVIVTYFYSITTLLLISMSTKTSSQIWT